MTSPAAALVAIKARLAANFSSISVYWDGDQVGNLPDTPTAFALGGMAIDDAQIVAFGSGRGGNTQRNFGFLEFSVLTPVESGAAVGLTYGEAIALVFRGQRFDNVSCFETKVTDSGRRTNGHGRDHDNGNYRITEVLVNFFFDSAA